MTEKQIVPAVMDKLYENQVALAAAIEELALWVEVRGEDVAVADNIRGALDTLDRNAEHIGKMIHQLKELPLIQ
jgi:hypothetical protein